MRAPLHPLLQEIFQYHSTAQGELGPWHLGGPQPCAPRRALASIAVEAAAKHPVWRNDDPKLVASARALLAGSRDQEERLRMLIREAEPPSVAWHAANAALHTIGRTRNLPRAARSAIAAAAQRLGKWQALELAVEVDDQLMKAEVHAYLDRRKIATRISNLAYRAGDQHGNPFLWLTRTVNPDGGEAGWGTLYRVKGLHWTEGTREVALAAIPDEHLEAACAIVLESSKR
jgi:hypothetical protein